MNTPGLIESVLFAAGEPVPLSELASVVGIPKGRVRNELEAMSTSFAERGVRLVFDDRVAQLVTAPESADTVAKFVQAELRGGLSQAALETLAVIAYNGPVTRPQIEALRGVQSAPALRTLTIRGLVTEVGRAETPGRPIVYDVTVELYKALGISSREELPMVEAEMQEAAAKVLA